MRIETTNTDYFEVAAIPDVVAVRKRQAVLASKRTNANPVVHRRFEREKHAVARIGNFKRTGITEYNSEKTDVSAGYDEESLATTVYVYPAPSLTAIGLSKSEIDDAQEHLCAQAWQGIQSDITRVHPDAELIAVDQVSSPSLFFTKLGRRAIYLFTGNFRGRVQPLRSEAHLFCYAGQHWLVAFRTTAPASLDYRADLDAVMSGLQWPSSLRR